MNHFKKSRKAEQSKVRVSSDLKAVEQSLAAMVQKSKPVKGDNSCPQSLREACNSQSPVDIYWPEIIEVVGQLPNGFTTINVDSKVMDAIRENCRRFTETNWCNEVGDSVELLDTSIFKDMNRLYGEAALGIAFNAYFTLFGIRRYKLKPRGKNARQLQFVRILLHHIHFGEPMPGFLTYRKTEYTINFNECSITSKPGGYQPYIVRDYPTYQLYLSLSQPSEIERMMEEFQHDKAESKLFRRTERDEPVKKAETNRGKRPKEIDDDLEL